MATPTRNGFRTNRTVSFRSPLTSPQDSNGDVVDVSMVSVSVPKKKQKAGKESPGKKKKSKKSKKEVQGDTTPLVVATPAEAYHRDVLETPGANNTAAGFDVLAPMNAPSHDAIYSHEPVDASKDSSGYTSAQVAKLLHAERFKRAVHRGATIHDISEMVKAKEVHPLGAESEMGMEPYQEERVNRYLSYYTQTLTVALILTAQALFIWKQVSITQADGYWLRMINVVWVPVGIFFMLFAVQYGINQVICAFGPIAHMQTNSQFFSAIAPPRPLVYPKMTIQMPVYKEGLEGTIIPTLHSLEAAIRHYRKAGGECKIFINDDGLQLISEEDRAARIATYKEHDIGYIARPPEDVRPRKGLFKKASNMNYSLCISVLIQHAIELDGLTLEQAEQKAYDQYNNEFLMGGDVLMGEIILLIDSDTRVPVDCLTNIVGEFELTPQLGFLQCRTTPLREDYNYWENMIAHFTEAIYDIGICLAVSAGDPAPLVGHNAFLRWEAVQQASWKDKQDGEQKFWSEDHVSEDFDMSLRLQTLGYIGRYCTYTGAGFQEGVSLTAADELIRLRKYAFGACEMVLNRFKDWPCKGPLTGMYIRYITSPGVPWPAKLQMSGYLGTYVAMAYAIIGVSAYVAVRIWSPELQESVTNTFDIYMTTLLLFGGIGCISSGTIRYRMGQTDSKSIFGAVWDEFKYGPAVTTFFASTLWHLTTACWNYFWDIPMVWGATVKELEITNFWFEFTTTCQRYKNMFFIMIGYAIVFCFLMWWYHMPWEDIRLTFPVFNYVLFHIFGPFLLNPTLMRGHY